MSRLARRRMCCASSGSRSWMASASWPPDACKPTTSEDGDGARGWAPEKPPNPIPALKVAAADPTRSAALAELLAVRPFLSRPMSMTSSSHYPAKHIRVPTGAVGSVCSAARDGTQQWPAACWDPAGHRPPFSVNVGDWACRWARRFSREGTRRVRILVPIHSCTCVAVRRQSVPFLGETKAPRIGSQEVHR